MTSHTRGPLRRCTAAAVICDVRHPWAYRDCRRRARIAAVACFTRAAFRIRRLASRLATVSTIPTRASREKRLFPATLARAVRLLRRRTSVIRRMKGSRRGGDGPTTRDSATPSPAVLHAARPLKFRAVKFRVYDDSCFLPCPFFLLFYSWNRFFGQ